LEQLISLQKAGKRIKALEERPLLLPGLDFIFSGYRTLETDKPITMGGAGFIPFNSIVQWCYLHQIYDINDIERISRYFRAMECADIDFNEKASK